jgi:TRAP-type C4-dicarboxylate transport system substrate-binding protein
VKLFQEKYEMATFTGGLKDDEEQTRKLESMGVTFVKPDPKEVEKYLANVPPILEQWKKRVGPMANELIGAVNKALGTKY